MRIGSRRCGGRAGGRGGGGGGGGGAAGGGGDRAGTLVISDSGNNRVRVVAAGSGRFYGRAMTAGDVYTVAGDGSAGFAGDGGPATRAELQLIPPNLLDGQVPLEGVAVDGAGNLVIADGGNGRVRVAAARAARFYGRAMTARPIYTITAA